MDVDEMGTCQHCYKDCGNDYMLQEYFDFGQDRSAIEAVCLDCAWEEEE